MSVESNKALLRRYKVEILNSRDLDALDEVAAVDYLDHAALPGQAPGLAGLKQRVTTLWQALDPQWTIDDIIAEGDLVVLRWSHVGRHVGEFIGIPPTGRTFINHGIDMYRVRDGKMAEHWNVVDLFGFYQSVSLTGCTVRSTLNPTLEKPEEGSLPDRWRRLTAPPAKEARRWQRRR